jgi:aspartate/methionine/tyrosine aminotransferase
VSFHQSSRLASVQTPVIPVVTRWTAETPGTISLGQGLVSWAPPDAVLSAARRFGRDAGDHAYTPIEGIPALVEAIERKLARENGVAVAPGSRVVVTAGGNLAFVTAALAVLDTGDEVIFPVPFYFNHEMAVAMTGARPVPVPTTPDYRLDLDAIAAAVTPRTRAIVTVSPNNPTGHVYSESDLRAVNGLCGDRGLFHIHDEAYEYFTYGPARHVSPGSFAGAADHTISLYSLSKSFGFASWRIGYLVVPMALSDAIDKIQDTVIICAPGISQYAALAALDLGDSFVRPRVATLAPLRRVVLDALAGIPGCEATGSDGAFYTFVRIRTARDSMTAAEQLIREHRVAVVPGKAFGDIDSCSMRVSYGMLDRAGAEAGAARLAAGLRSLGASS